MSYDKLSAVVSVILLCLALSLIVELPTTFSSTRFSAVVLSLPLTIRLSTARELAHWLTTALLAGMACSGTASIIRLHPLHREKRTFVSCILPALATLEAAILLPRAPDRIYALGGLVMMGILLPLIITAEYRALDTSTPDYNAIRLGLNFIAYLIALVLFVLIHESRAHPLLSPVAALVGSSLLALDLLHDAQQGLRRAGLYALIVGLVMGEIVWTLSYSTLNNLTAGILLLLIFYLITSLARQGLLESLNRRILIEFAVVALIGVALLLKYAP